MVSFPTGSIQSWLVVAAPALSPLIALLAGFAGTDWWLRWQLGELRDDTPLERRETGEARR
jgi:hypothetical protein